MQMVSQNPSKINAEMEGLVEAAKEAEN